MRYEFYIQDLDDDRTTYFLEALLTAAVDSEMGSAVFAFATAGGVDALLGDEEFQSFLGQGRFDLTVGVGAITDTKALARLGEYQAKYKDRLTVSVFLPPGPGLFHPKAAWFQAGEGSGALLVGSGNLTEGGLRTNYEAYSVLWATKRELQLAQKALRRFKEAHEGCYRQLDDPAVVSRATTNALLQHQKRPKPPGPTSMAEVSTGRPLPTSRVLIAEVPSAGDRWHQVHLNRQVIDSYFRVKPNSRQRVFLWECGPGGNLGKLEARPCVFSAGSNRNLKIEIAARQGEPYPAGGEPPIAVYRETAVRQFQYLLLFPDEPGYERLRALAASLPTQGRGLRRVLTTLSDVIAAWPGCPFKDAPFDAPQL